jgi:hypothetical protein
MLMVELFLTFDTTIIDDDKALRTAGVDLHVGDHLFWPVGLGGALYNLLCLGTFKL